MGPSPIRRIVTRHTSDGKAVFDAVEHLIGVNTATKAPPADDTSPTLTSIHRTTGYPVTLQGSRDEFKIENLHRSKISGIVCQVVDIPPPSKALPVHFHRNQSLDYGVILKGSIVLELEDGKEKTLREGDIYVQRGTMHSWKNVSDEYCRFMTVIVPSEQVRVESTGEHLEATKLAGLTD